MNKAALALRRMVSQESNYPFFIPILQFFEKDTIMTVFLSALMQAEANMEYNDYQNEELEGYFRFPRVMLQEATGIGVKKQSELNKRLLSLGVLEQKKVALTGFKYYRLNWEKLTDIFNKYTDYFRFSSLRKNLPTFSFLHCKKHNLEITDSAAPVVTDIQSTPAYAKNGVCDKEMDKEEISQSAQSTPAYAENSVYKNNTKGEKGVNTKYLGRKAEDSDTSYPRLHFPSQIGFAGKSSGSQEALGEKKETQPLTAKKEKPLLSKAPVDLLSFKGMTKPKVGAVAQRRVRCAPEVYSLILSWNNDHGTVVHKVPPLVKGYVADPTKTVERAIRYLTAALEGTLYSNIPGLSDFNRTFTPDMIRKAIKNHSRACLDKSVLPVKKDGIKAVSLPDFLFNERNVELGMEFSAAMLYYFLKPPMDSKNYVPEIKFTEMEQRVFDRGVKALANHWGSFEVDKLDESEMKNLRLGVRHASKFLVNTERFYTAPGFCFNENSILRWYIEKCIKVNGGEFGWEDVGSRLTPLKIIRHLEDEGEYSEGGFFPGLMNIENPDLRMALGKAREKIIPSGFYDVWFRDFTTPPPSDPETKERYDRYRKEWTLEKKRIMAEFEDKKSSKPVGMKRRTSSK